MIRFIATWEHFETKLNITILEEPGTHKAVHISLLAVSTTYDVTRETKKAYLIINKSLMVTL